MQRDISVVVPTHNREVQIYEKVRWLLEESGVSEVIVVIDGSKDKTQHKLESIADPRLRLLVNGKALGPSISRNLGISVASCSWVALLDDDDYHSEGFLLELVSVANESKADIVGTPWLHFDAGTSPDDGFEHALRAATGPSLLSPSIVPDVDWRESLWLPNNVLVRRAVLEQLQFDEGYLGNYWREETDFFVSAVRAGHKVVVTNRAYSYQFEKPSGGIMRTNRLIYEFWVIRNDLRFMRRHGRWLAQQDEIEGVTRFMMSSLWRRLRPLLRRFVRKQKE